VLGAVYNSAGMMSGKGVSMSGVSIDGKNSDATVAPKVCALPADGSNAPAEPTNASAPDSIENRLVAWVKSVEKDTETQIQEYLEQVDAGQSGE